MSSDVIIIFVLILGFNLIYYMQKDYVQQFDEDSVEARDFTIVIDSLPSSFHKYKDELSLKFAIWKQIQTKFTVCKQQNYCHEDLDTSIVDINFGLANIEYLERQKRILGIIEELENKHIRVVKTGGQSG